ncbi:hypothetical protein D5085_04855 [Ectothiorhodospiraceae bacterium BW-2]|nr:hypothetical protein D5085_04855 [Ectothiorhodospiraceae bacterium BW-2]
MNVCYRLNPQNTIIDVNANWDRFALENAAGQLCRQRIIGLPLERFIQGDTTQMFVRTMLQSVRLRQLPLTRQYRCDSPDRRRLMQMTLIPATSGEVALEHRLLQETPFPLPFHFATVQSPTPLPKINRCSHCNRLNRPPDLDWLDPQQLLPAPDPTQPITVHYTICPKCHRLNHACE